jgi:hypothetical protein
VSGPLIGSFLGSFLPTRFVLLLIGVILLGTAAFTRYMKPRLRKV